MSTGFSPVFCRLKRSGDRWFAFAGKPESGPVDTVSLLTEAPEFLGGAFPGGALPRAAMVVPQSQSNRVLLAVDEAGGLMLVACPGSGADMSALVGELVGASAKLWHQKYETIGGPFEEFLGMSLVDWIAARTGEGWSADAFRTGIEVSLAQGKSPVVVVVAALDPQSEEALAYLRNMNIDVRPLVYDRFTSDGDELLRPRLLIPEMKTPEPAKETPKVERPQPPPCTPPAKTVQPAPAQRTAPGAFSSEYTPTVTISGPSQYEAPVREFESFPPSDASPKQLEILNRLVQLDALGLKRKGFEFFLPRAESKETSEGTIVIAIDPDRWPFPKNDEVIVVVRTGQDHLASYLRIAPRDVEDFLGSLPRVERKEHKGALLLRAGNTHEAAQLVNELRALKEVSAST